jgi:hypothetical protein
MLSATLLVLAVAVIAAGLYAVRVSPLARPEGVPPHARNLGNVIQPSYWHWCEQVDGERYCETFSRRGGFPLYSGRYLPVAPQVVTQIASLDSARFPEAAEITRLLRMSTIFDDGYNWPLVERISPLGARERWSYRFVLPGCLEAISSSDVDGFSEQATRWRDGSDGAYLDELIRLFATIDVELRQVSELEVMLSDTVAGASGTSTLALPRQCYGRIYLSSDDSAGADGGNATTME